MISRNPGVGIGIGVAIGIGIEMSIDSDLDSESDSDPDSDKHKHSRRVLYMRVGAPLAHGGLPRNSISGKGQARRQPRA